MGLFMNYMDEYQIGLNKLVIFRNLLQDPAIEKLMVLFNAKEKDTPALVGHYAAFLQELYKRTDCLTDYLLSFILEDENLYVRMRAAGRDIPPAFLACLKDELNFLELLGRLTSEELRTRIGYNGFLPPTALRAWIFRLCMRSGCPPSRKRDTAFLPSIMSLP